MNERLKELAEQAGLYHRLGSGNLYPTNFTAEQSVTAYQTFAQLIVRECMSVIGEENYGMLTGKANCTKIKRHFGVSE